MVCFLAKRSTVVEKCIFAKLELELAAFLLSNPPSSSLEHPYPHTASSLHPKTSPNLAPEARQKVYLFNGLQAHQTIELEPSYL
jgi:hypothetical protein